MAYLTMKSQMGTRGITRAFSLMVARSFSVPHQTTLLMKDPKLVDLSWRVTKAAMVTAMKEATPTGMPTARPR